MAYCVDLRSDTLTKPTERMRDAMRNADVGDDTYGEDPTVNSLEKYVAELLGKEAAMLVPTGTMGNLTSVMTHCNERGSQIICGDKCHIYLCEQGGSAQIAGATFCPLKNLQDGTYDYNDFIQNLHLNPDVHTTKTKLVLVENTHNLIGGRVVPLDWLSKIWTKCQEIGVPVHMDGARIWNAAVALNIPPKDILRYCDTASVCFSKGLGAPIGSIVVGSSDFIQRARRARKVLGGTMRQSGVIAAACRVALDEILPILKQDHIRAHRIASAISELRNPNLIVRLDEVESNIFFLFTTSGSKFVKRMAQVTEGDTTCVKVSSRSEDWVRFTLHHQISDADVEKVIEKIKMISNEF